jgi:UDP-4-amino-4-deoxy-L-arabinose-oxoglutarate aminotransferase
MMPISVPHSRPWIDQSDLLAVNELLKSRMIAKGLRVQAFEQAVSYYLGATSAIACASGTAALSLALKVLRISSGDEVILPTYVCWSVLAAVRGSGAVPCLCDVDDSGVVTVQTVRAALTPKTRAIIAVHMFGHPCDINSISTLGIPVIEDACQAFGLKVSGRSAGTLGDLGILSFHATKCLTTGEGGMLLTNNPSLINLAHLYEQPIEQNNAAGTFIMSDLQAALGLAQLDRYATFLDRRQELFASYNEITSKLANVSHGYVGMPKFLFRYTLRIQSCFESSQASLLINGVHSRRGVDELLHRRIGLNDRNFPCAIKLFDQVISIPFYPSITEQERKKVVRALKVVFYGA